MATPRAGLVRRCLDGRDKPDAVGNGGDIALVGGSDTPDQPTDGVVIPASIIAFCRRSASLSAALSLIFSVPSGLKYQAPADCIM